jgi:hypothetical protein
MGAGKIALVHDLFRTRVTSSFDSNACTRKGLFQRVQKTVGIADLKHAADAYRLEFRRANHNAGTR